jgi:hypothetical protein
MRGILRHASRSSIFLASSFSAPRQSLKVKAFRSFRENISRFFKSILLLFKMPFCQASRFRFRKITTYKAPSEQAASCWGASQNTLSQAPHSYF